MTPVNAPATDQTDSTLNRNFLFKKVTLYKIKVSEAAQGMDVSFDFIQKILFWGKKIHPFFWELGGP